MLYSTQTPLKKIVGLMCFNERRKNPQRRNKEGTKKATPPKHHRSTAEGSVEGSPRDWHEKSTASGGARWMVVVVCTPAENRTLIKGLGNLYSIHWTTGAALLRYCVNALMRKCLCYCVSMLLRFLTVIEAEFIILYISSSWAFRVSNLSVSTYSLVWSMSSQK